MIPTAHPRAAAQNETSHNYGTFKSPYVAVTVEGWLTFSVLIIALARTSLADAARLVRMELSSSSPQAATEKASKTVLVYLGHGLDVPISTVRVTMSKLWASWAQLVIAEPS